MSRNNSVSHDRQSPGDTLHPSSAVRPRLRHQSVSVPQSEHDRADAMWMELQNTLAEVELSAENTTHLFGGEHTKALEELRHAQLALALAWARTEGEETSEQSPGKDGLEKKLESIENKGNDGQVKESKDSAAVAQQRGSFGIEEETEADIIMARKRREANDKYFQKVNAGVLDVVAKLEEVALAMRKVEKESRDIWSETDTIEDTDATDPTEGINSE